MTFQPSRLTNYDKETLLGEIRRVVNGFFHGQAPSCKEFVQYSRVHYSTVIKHFGSWSKSMREAGFEHSRSPLKLAQLEEDLRRVLAQTEGNYFTGTFYERNGGLYTVETLKARFGCSSWSDLLENVLNVKPVRRVLLRRPRPITPTREVLAKELGRVWSEIGRRPTYDEFRRHARIGTKVYEREYGSWKNAIATLSRDLPSAPPWAGKTHCPSELLLEELRSIAGKTGSDTLAYREYRSMGGVYSIGTFQNHFGSWAKAISLIGLKDGHWSQFVQKNFSDQDFFDELQRVWEFLGRQPGARELKRNGSKISWKAFQKRFGSWSKAIHAFCADRNRLEQNEIAPAAADSTISTDQESKQNTPLFGTTRTQEKFLDVIKMSTPRIPSPRLRWRIFDRDKFTCCSCGRSRTKYPTLELHADHITPYSKGGETIFDNLQTLCGECNIGKADSITKP